jgi:23S rRNA pseudouridine1911/1915/1917 synthase
MVSMMTGCSRSVASDLVAAGEVLVNGDPVTTRGHRLAEGDEVDVTAPTDVAAPEVVGDPRVAVDVVYEDDQVVVVNKAPGVVVHPGAGNPDGTLANGLVHRYPALVGVGAPERPGIVHRLDADTSGLLVVARTPAAYDDLVAQLATRTVERRYLALVWGTLEPRRGRIDAPVGRSRRQPTRMTVSTAGREAITDYEVEQVFTDPVEVALVRCSLHTGRTHQIRVHLRSIGHPVVGDAQYGGVRQSLVVPRLWLHAATLAFDHPVTGERLEFTAPVPGDLAAVLDQLV